MGLCSARGCGPQRPLSTSKLIAELTAEHRRLDDQLEQLERRSLTPAEQTEITRLKTETPDQGPDRPPPVSAVQFGHGRDLARSRNHRGETRRCGPSACARSLRTFWHQGTSVTHARLRQALLRWLDVLPDGRNIVRLDAKRYAYVDVEDAHLRARSAHWSGDRCFILWDDDSESELDYASLRDHRVRPLARLNDSKQVDEATRDELYRAVLACAERVSVHVFPPGVIDRDGLHKSNLRGLREALWACSFP
jgi:hypothetical protein